VKVGWFELHSFAELLARSFAVAGLQEGIGEVLADIAAVRRERRGLFEKRDGGVVIVKPQGVEGFRKRFVGGVFNVLSERGGGNQAERCKSNRRLPLVSVGILAEILNYLRLQPRFRKPRLLVGKLPT
jgi:hypothetical protein